MQALLANGSGVLRTLIYESHILALPTAAADDDGDDNVAAAAAASVMPSMQK